MPPPGGSHGRPQSNGAGNLHEGLPGHIIALRPLTVGDVLDGIFQSVRASIGPLLGIVLLVVGPYQLLSSATFAQIVPGFGSMTDPADLEAMFSDIVGILGWLAVLLVVGLVVNVIVAGALTVVAGEADRGRRVSIGDALRRSIEHSGATIGATVLVLFAGVLTAIVLALPLGLLALASELVALVLALPVLLLVVVAGLVLSSLVIPVAIEEHRGAWTTFVRALSLLRRRFGAIVGLTLLVMLLLMAVTLGLSFVFVILSFVLGGAGWIAEAVQAILSSLVSAPVTALAAWVIHRDARVRLEAYDVVVRNQALGGGSVA